MRILINRSDAIGDTLLTLPVVSLLKEFYPNLKLTCLVSKRSFELFQFQNKVDSILVYPEHMSFFQKLKWCWKNLSGYSHYLYVGGAFLPSWVALLKGVPWRGGLRHKWHGMLLLKDGVRQSRSSVLQHESEYNLELIRGLTPKNISFPKNLLPYMPFSLKAEKTSELDKRLKEILKQQSKSWREDLVIVHPGMQGHTLNWPPESYAQLLKILESKNPGKFLFIITHTPKDALYIQAFQKELGNAHSERVLFLNGAEQGLPFTIELIGRARLFIGGSTGPTHLANSLGTPLVTFYSPIQVQRAKRWGPLGGQSINAVLEPNVDCPEVFECRGERCQYFPCMQKITVELALEKCSVALGPPLR